MPPSNREGLRVVWGLLLSLVLLVGVLTIPSRTAIAFPLDGIPPLESCAEGDNEVTHRFSGPFWTDLHKLTVSSALEEWEAGLLSDGSVAVDWVEELSSGEEVLVYWANLPMGFLGWGSCEGGFLQLNWLAMFTDLDLVESVARHEGGHILGIDHGGDDDSFDDDNPPTMSTCITEAAMKEMQYSQDDEGTLLYHLDSTTNPWLHANPSFERGTEFWGRNGGSWQVSTSGSHTGDQHLMFKPSVISDNVFQTMAFAFGEPDELVQTPRVNATARARLNSGTDDGEIIVSLMVRQRDYVGDSFCYYPIGRDMNNGSYPNGKAWEIVSSSGWTDITSATQWVGAWAAQHTFDEDWHAADVRVKIRSRIETSGGSYAWVHLDVARSEDRSIP